MKGNWGAARWPMGVALLLMAANALSFVDRMLLTLMVGPVRAELGISDTQLSLLHGFAFALFYAIAGLPLGKMADSGDRPRIMAGGVALWSVMTAMCGVASNFALLFASRVGVAIGEASLYPSAISLLSSRFPRSLVSRAIAVFQSGIFLGTALAMLGGAALLGWFETQKGIVAFTGLSPWRLVFITLGMPGLLVAAMLLFVREPRRAEGAEAPPLISWGAAARHILGNGRLYGGHFLAFTSITILGYGSLSWMPSVLVRSHGLSTADAGFLLGVALLIAGPIGVLSSGWLADHFAKRRMASGPMLTAVIAIAFLAVATPFFALSPTLAQVHLAAFLLALAQSFPYGISSASLVAVAPEALRGRVLALYLMISNLFGLTCGPLFVALLTDRYFEDDQKLYLSLALLPVLTTPIALAGIALCWKSYRAAWVRAQETPIGVGV